MERRVLLAIFLCFLVLYVWQALIVKPVPEPAPGTPPATTAGGLPVPGGTPPSSTSSTSTPGPLPSPEASSTDPVVPAATPVVGETTEREIRVETDSVIA